MDSEIDVKALAQKVGGDLDSVGLIKFDTTIEEL